MYFISNVQPGLINNFVPYNNRYDVFYEKYMPIKTSFHGRSPLCCFIHTPCIVLNSNATFVFPTPHKSQLLSPKIWETRDQPGPLFSREARRGKSLGTRLTSLWVLACEWVLEKNSPDMVGKKDS